MNGVKFLRNKNNNARKSFSQLQTMSTRKRFNRCRRRCLSRKRIGGGTKVDLSGISYEIFFVKIPQTNCRYHPPNNSNASSVPCRAWPTLC